MSVRPGFLLSLALHAALAMAGLYVWQPKPTKTARPNRSLLMTFDISPPAERPESNHAASASRTPAAPAPVLPLQAKGSPPAVEYPSATPQPTPPTATIQLPTPSTAEDASDLKHAYAARIWQHIARFKPRGARISGTTAILIEIAPDGGLVAASLAASSGSTRLDRLAIDAATRASPYPPPPHGLGQADRQFVIPFTFR